MDVTIESQKSFLVDESFEVTKRGSVVFELALFGSWGFAVIDRPLAFEFLFHYLNIYSIDSAVLLSLQPSFSPFYLCLVLSCAYRLIALYRLL